MKALFFDGSRLELLSDYPMPRPRGGWALVRVQLAGICGTDLEILRGYASFKGILGHEFVGVMEEPSSHPLAGRLVVGEINIGCGRCASCRAGQKNHCESRRALGIRGWDGAFAEYVLLPEENLHAVPEGVTPQEAVFTEPLAAAYEIVEQVRVTKGLEVAVIGDGRLGLLVAQVLKSEGCRVLLIGKHERKLSMARGLGIAAVRRDALEPGRRFEVVVEASGSPSGLQEAIGLIRPRGTIVVKSTYHGAAQVDLSRIVVDEVTVIGSRCGPFPRALEALAKGAVSVRELVDGVYELEKWQEAFASAQRPGALKVMLRP
jgi:threonine dehydrogenase-like Zn-dependent dehydrogenase